MTDFCPLNVINLYCTILLILVKASRMYITSIFTFEDKIARSHNPEMSRIRDLLIEIQSIFERSEIPRHEWPVFTWDNDTLPLCEKEVAVSCRF